MATHSSILAWKNPKDRVARWAAVHRVAKRRTRLNTHFVTYYPSTSALKDKNLALLLSHFEEKVKVFLVQSGKRYKRD